MNAEKAHPIDFVIGRPHGRPAAVVASIHFPTQHWKLGAVRAWLKRNGFKASPVERLRAHFAAPQHPAGYFIRGSLRTVHTSGHAHPLKNPRGARLSVPERDLQQAVTLYRRFREAEPEKIAAHRFTLPRVLMQVGPIPEVMYYTTHRGRPKLYRHTFARHAMPMLCVSSDGRSLYLLGGRYDFTRDGIVDR